jgi:hypothetical protein
VSSPPLECDPAGFAQADLEHDDDVDLRDFALFSGLFDGA